LVLARSTVGGPVTAPGAGLPVTSTIHLVRHGQSEWNARGLLQGQTAHVRLSALGRRQAEAAAQALATCTADALFTSDLTRAVQTAEAIARAVGRPARIEPRLREQAYGRFEGRPSREVYAAVAGADWHDPDLRIGGGESSAEVYARVGAALRQCLAASAGSIVLVSHGDTIRIAAAWLSGHGPGEVPWIDTPNGSITTVRLVDGIAVDQRTTCPVLDA
jgi:broad specificity phosphatase PhoE